MTTERVLWTALPNHFDEQGRLRLSVFVAPRLQNDNPGDHTQRGEPHPGARSLPVGLIE